MNELAIRASGLGKTYRIYERPYQRLLELLGARRRHREFIALDGVSFELPRGEGLGIVGENGAGKSTLLKVLSGITTPSRGSFRVAGKIAAILELGSGFHPEFTGRQNAVLNAALLGLDEREVAAALPRILDFSELGEFIDQPVKAYSTGMSMRLAFSIATQVDPEVLIIDEALSVGDGYFQKKCLDRLLAFIRDGGTVLFCSHAMYYVTALCQHALWLRNGRVERFGPALEVVAEYEEFLLQKEHRRPRAEEAASGEPAPPDAEPSVRPARLAAVTLLGGSDPERPGGLRRYRHGAPLALEIDWQAESPELPCHFGVGIDRSDGVQVYSIATHQDGLAARSGGGRVRLELPSCRCCVATTRSTSICSTRTGSTSSTSRSATMRSASNRTSYRIGLTTVDHRWRMGRSKGGGRRERPPRTVHLAGDRQTLDGAPWCRRRRSSLRARMLESCGAPPVDHPRQRLHNRARRPAASQRETG